MIVKDMIIPVSTVTKNLTLKVSVSGLAMQKFRFKVAALIVHVATWVAGCKFEIEVTKP